MFENQYYCFVSGLPTITFDTTKLSFSVEEFRQMLSETLAPADMRLIDLYFLKYDNKSIVRFLIDKHADPDLPHIIGVDEWTDAVASIEVDAPVNNKRILPYFEQFIRHWLDSEATAETKQWEDLITSYYMDYGISQRNKLVAQWFEFNLNIGNILTAIYCRKYAMNAADVIVGTNSVAETIRENIGARDFGLGSELDYLDALLRLSEETDIFERERKIDKLRWDWLDDSTVFDYFDVEYIFAYLCKLQILQRWVGLNAEEGDRMFRELIKNLKSGITIPQED